MYVCMYSIDTESRALDDCQFLADAIIKLRGFHVVGIPLHTVVWGMMGRVIYFEGLSVKGSLLYSAWLFTGLISIL